MNFLRREFGTIIVVTTVTVLIWAWAAGETRTQQDVFARLEFRAPTSGQYIVDTDTQQVSISIEGSRLAIQKAIQLLEKPLDLPIGVDGVPGDPGQHFVDLVSVLRQHDELRSTGATITGSSPTTAQLSVDELVTARADVRLTLPNTQLAGDAIVDPGSVTLTMPASLRDSRTGTFVVDAVGTTSLLSQLTPGREHEIEIALRPPEGIDLDRDRVTIEPSKVVAKFTIQSQISETTLDSVRLQLSCPHEVLEEFDVDLNPTNYQDVTVRASRDVISAIESGEMVVIGFVHLSSNDCESSITSKPVTYFMAMDRRELALTGGVSVDVERNDDSMPDIGITVSRAANGTP
ncbi:MAG: hypothetical protein AAF432_03905 [Planctomycetota bacterium]